jgi:predicted outer membrane protein
MLRLVRFTLVALSVLLLLAAACGGDDDSTSTATDAPDATEATSETDSGDGNGGNGSDASPELEDYFAEMDEIARRTDNRLDEISSELQNATFDSDAEEIAANRDGFQQSGEVIESALLDISDLDPPPEVETAHAEFFDALNASLQILAAMFAAMEDISTSEELDATAEQYTPDLESAGADFDEACLALQGIADDNGINADLRCTD